MPRPARLLALALCLALPSVAAAQDGVRGSGMGQGEARITSRSNVALAMRGLQGTSGARVSALGRRVGQTMRALRTCYTARVAEDPRVTGRLVVNLLLEERGPLRVVVAEDQVGDRPLVRCVERALGAVDATELFRPTRAAVELTFTNSAAEGAAEAASRAQEASEVAIGTDAQGRLTSAGGTHDGRVRFAMTSLNGNDEEDRRALTFAHNRLLSRLPGFIDCRRRAMRRQGRPEGRVELVLRVPARAAPIGRVRRSTVADERSRRCVARVLRRLEARAPEGARGRFEVTVTYAARQADE